MQKSSYSQKLLSSKRKANSLKTFENSKKSSKISIKVANDNKKIPRIINQIQQNLILLKKYYEQEQLQPQTHQHNEFRRRPSRPSSSSRKNKLKSNEEHIIQQQTTVVVPQLDDLKKSFISMNGYDTNNIIQLYNFYKKTMERSTRLFGSTSMSNVVNITNNHSQIREKGIKPNSGSIITQDLQPNKENDIKQCGFNNAPSYQQNHKISFMKNDSSLKKNTDMISVANLLADKKKVSRVNICENMNSQNLISQAKRRLYRPTPNENIQKFNRLKQNLKGENIRISPGKKIKKESQNNYNQEINKIIEIKEKSSKKFQQDPITSRKTDQIKNNNNQHLNSLCQIAKKHDIKKNQKQILINVVQGLASPNQNADSVKKNVENIIINQCKDVKELKSAKSGKSQKSIKSIKSPHSFRSPSLNRGIILDVTGSCGQSSKKNSGHAYFIPRVNAHTHDSLLDCEITPKDQSKVLDLESIPFDF